MRLFHKFGFKAAKKVAKSLRYIVLPSLVFGATAPLSATNLIPMTAQNQSAYQEFVGLPPNSSRLTPDATFWDFGTTTYSLSEDSTKFFKITSDSKQVTRYYTLDGYTLRYETLKERESLKHIEKSPRYSLTDDQIRVQYNPSENTVYVAFDDVQQRVNYEVKFWSITHENHYDSFSGSMINSDATSINIEAYPTHLWRPELIIKSIKNKDYAVFNANSSLVKCHGFTVKDITFPSTSSFKGCKKFKRKGNSNFLKVYDFYKHTPVVNSLDINDTYFNRIPYFLLRGDIKFRYTELYTFDGKLAIDKTYNLLNNKRNSENNLRHSYNETEYKVYVEALSTKYRDEDGVVKKATFYNKYTVNNCDTTFNFIGNRLESTFPVGHLYQFKGSDNSATSVVKIDKANSKISFDCLGKEIQLPNMSVLFTYANGYSTSTKTFSLQEFDQEPTFYEKR